MMRPNKLEGLSLETLSSQVLKFESKARANPIGVPFRCFQLGKVPSDTSKCQTRLESDCQVQNSSLFGLIISNKGKKFYNIDTWSWQGRAQNEWQEKKCLNI